MYVGINVKNYDNTVQGRQHKYNRHITYQLLIQVVFVSCFLCDFFHPLSYNFNLLQQIGCLGGDLAIFLLQLTVFGDERRPVLFPLGSKFAQFLCTNTDQILNKSNNRNKHHMVEVFSMGKSTLYS